MLQTAKTLLEILGIDAGALYRRLSAASIEAATAEQGLGDLRTRLRATVPDVSDQYTTHFDPAEYTAYWEPKMRGLHAFQIGFVLDVLNDKGLSGAVIADIGDSSGNHARYLKALAPPGTIGRVISVNLDPVAVDKVIAKGGDALLCRAEELDHRDIRPDLALSFEMVEHLTDPVRFLRGLATKGSADTVLISVPHARRSRFGGHHLRMPEATMPARMTPEEVHVYEFSADDWALLARFAGFRVAERRIYLQYPRRHPLRLTAPLWRKLDFEGFVMFRLERDLSVADRYTGW